MRLIHERSTEEVYYLNVRMARQIRKYPPTQPFHSKKKCPSHKCVWHAPKDN